LLCCPDCGSTDFRQDRPATLRFTMSNREGYWYDTAEETVDTDRDGEICCDDCGREVADDELVTVEEYNLLDDWS
jgi:hypothetical protein